MKTIWNYTLPIRRHVRGHFSLTCRERFVATLVLVFVLQMLFPQYSHAAVTSRVNRDIDFSTVLVITRMRAKGETINAPSLGYDFAGAQHIEVTKQKPAKRTMWVLVTAYSSTPDQTDDSPYMAARGTFVRDGMVAANYLAFGTRLRFPDEFGDKEFFVEDRMNRRYDKRIDIWMPTRAQAREWGARWVKVEIL